MTTKEQMIEIIKAENPEGLRIGNDEQYIDLTSAEYDALIVEWAEARLAKKTKMAEAEAVSEAKKQAVIKLTELGIDPKAFDLQTEPLTDSNTQPGGN